MKRIFGTSLVVLMIGMRAYAEYGIPTEKIYNFDRANVASVLAEFIEDEKKAKKAADKYNELSNNSENAISAVDFVDVCVVGGLNMKLVDGSGYIKCLEMFMRLIEMQNMDAGGFDMYCPADGNALKSITDKTQVGDVCGGTRDTYIEYGYVTLKTDDKNGQHKYVCTCTPQSCKEGYYWNKEKHQCSVKDKEGYCVRRILGSFEYKKGKLLTSGVGLNDWIKKQNAYYNDRLAQQDAWADAFFRCVEYGANQGCLIRGALASADFGNKYRVICNPANYEIEADKKIREDKEKKYKAELAENMTYYEVCGEDKGKGKCVDDVFTNRLIGGTQVSYATGNALVIEYARVRLGDEITCGGDSYDKNIRKSGIEYYIKCRSVKDLTKYYEFKFDDLEESKDLTANASVYNAVWHIIYNYNIAKNSYNGYDTGTKANCDAVNATFRKICNGCGTEWRESGYTATMGKKFCYDLININTTCKKSPNDLNTAFDIDPFVFCKNTHNQLKNTSSMESLLKQYISDKSGYNVSKIECYPQTLCYNGTGCGGVTDPRDDIKTCVVHGDKDYTVDFVFDDVNEFSKKLSEVSMDAMQCVIGGNKISITLGFELDAKNKGKKCTGLDDKLCKDLDKMIRNRGGSGAQYDTKKRACILNSAEEYANQELAQNVAIGAVVAVGTSIFVIGSGGVGAALIVGGSMFAVDTAVNGGLYIVEKLEDGQAGRRFTRFINAAKKCKDSTCAQNVIKNHYNDLASGKEDYNYEDAAELQKELDRLFGLMEGDFCWQDQNGNILNPDSNGKCDKLVAIIHLDAEDKSLQRASIGLMIGGFVFNPESAMMKLASKGVKLLRMSGKINEKVLLNAARTAEQNIVKVDKLDDATDAAVVAGSKIKNPTQWKPGEDVAEYMDVEKLQSKLDDIDKQHAAYLDELNTQLQDAEIRLSQTPKKTDAQSETAKIVEGQIDKRIEQLVAQEMDDFEEYNRIKNEFALQRKKITSEHREELIEILKEKGKDAINKYEDAINKYADSPEFTALSQRHKELSDKYWQINDKIRRSSDDAELLKLKTEREALVHGNSPEYNEVSNEIEYINALMEDAYKTIGDEKNVALWDAIPNEIKQKLPEIRDDEIVEILAKDDMLTHYVNNFDEVSKNAELYNDFLSRIARGVNDKHPMSIPVSIGTYTDAYSPRIGALAQPVDNSIGINTARRNDTDLDGTVGIIKHEVGHSIDHHRANDGILGQTLQDMKTWKNHGNSDPDIMVAISPSGLNEFSVGDISRNARNQLESEGWKFENISTPETREKYLAEPTEKSSWSITPTSNIKQKVNSYREANGVTK